MVRSARRPRGRPPLEPVAGNGLLDRRTLLGGSVLLAGATGVGEIVGSIDQRTRWLAPPASIKRKALRLL